MNFDLFCVGLVALLAIWGAIRGMVRQIFGLVGFVGGIILARTFAQPFGEAFAKDLGVPVTVATVAMSIAIFILVEVAAKIAGSLLAHLFKGGFTGAVDRVGGLVLGFAKGLLVAWAIASIVTLLRPHLRNVERDTVASKLDLAHSHAIAAASDTNLIAELRTPHHASR
ncbi:MAG TPA: CvpA family protein [Myxococcales bacterium]|nr:CvpA family protein [Myxococcales bacterium]